MLKKYTPTQIKDALQNFNSTLNEEWCIENNKLYKTFIFKNFNSAFEFMEKVAADAERLNHHPEWSNLYNKVEIMLITHDVNGISNRDFELAKAIETNLIK